MYIIHQGLKSCFCNHQIPSDKLVKLLNILEKNILDGANLSTFMNLVSSILKSFFNSFS